jgi:hypothetical protein
MTVLVKSNWLIGIVFAVSAGLAQPQARPEFEVASIRPGQPKDSPMFKMATGRFVAQSVTLRLLVAIAYGLQDYQISGGPAWVRSDSFDIEAKAENERADTNQVSLMVRSLLADRFKLILHNETRESSVYAGSGVPLKPLASLLGRQLGQTVIDRTELRGRFDIKLTWTPDLGQAQPAPDGGVATLPRADPSAPSVFTAIQEQLGLKLRSAKGPSGFLFIDRVEKPSAN